MRSNRAHVAGERVMTWDNRLATWSHASKPSDQRANSWTEGGRCVPPRTTGPVVDVFWARPSCAPSLRELISSVDWSRAELLPNPRDRSRSLTAAALLQTVVGELHGVAPRHVQVTRHCRTCDSGTHGRPMVDARSTNEASAPLYVSMAHAADRVVVAMATGWPVGVDVEELTAAGFDGFDAAALHPDERRELELVAPDLRPAWRAWRWTAKEALLKASGLGLAVSPSTLSLAPTNGPALAETPLPPPRLAGELVGGASIHRIDLGVGYAASLALLSPTPFAARVRDGNALLEQHASTGSTPPGDVSAEADGPSCDNPRR